MNHTKFTLSSVGFLLLFAFLQIGRGRAAEMSLGVALKGPEGIVLAADSRVTLFNQIQFPGAPAGTPPLVIPATYDNATKLLKVNNQNFVAAVTYGAGAIGQQQPRTAHSFLTEFETVIGNARVTVHDFATQLGQFFTQQWQAANMPPAGSPNLMDMVFLVGGYDQNAPYGEVYEVHVPSAPAPALRVPATDFGGTWGGQRSITDRLLQGFDFEAIQHIYDILHIPQNQQNPVDFETQLKQRVSLKIPMPFLPLQDSVDLAVSLVRTTIIMQGFAIDLRGVGGAVDVATITRNEGFKAVKLKQIVADNII